MSTPPKRRPAWLFPALLALQFAAFLLVLELLLAWFYPVPFRRPLPKVPDTAWTQLLHRRGTSGGLAYELTPGARMELRGAKISVNSLGFRGREYSVEKPPNTIRIVAMGASVAFGWTVSNDESYPQRLEARLNERAKGSGRTYEVFNFGVGGYSTHDEVKALEAKALRLNPDLVILDYHPNGPETEPIQPLHQVFHEPLWWERWNLLRLLAYGRRRWSVWTLGHGSEYRYLASPEGPHWPALLRSYDKLRALTEARGIKVLITIFPSYSGLTDWKQYTLGDVHAQVRKTAEEYGFLPVDIFPVYANSGHTVQEIAADDEHPGALGLDLAAAEMERVIVEHHQELLHLPPPGGPDAPR
jgi:hypothetical protein